MTPEELLSLILSHGHEARVKGAEVQVRACWSCGNDRWNLELNAGMGVWSCWNCRDAGALDRLLTSQLGIEVSVPVRPRDSTTSPKRVAPASFRQDSPLDVGSALAYLRRRGLTETDVLLYRIGVCSEPGHLLEGRIVFPVSDWWTGELLGHVGRSYTGRYPKYLSTAPRSGVAGHRTRSRTSPCLIVEGALDGVHTHKAGFQAAVLLGLPGAKQTEAVQRFAARLPPETPLGIMLDGSAQEEAQRLFWAVAPIRSVALIKLPPGADPGSCSPEELQAAFAASVLAKTLR